MSISTRPMKPLNVLSLFDGMSCGRIALQEAGIPVANYFASEIDKHAIKVSKVNWDDITHIGDVTKVSYQDGMLKTEVGEFEADIDLVIGGSPCQTFSVARTFLKTVTGLEGTSGLFYEYLRILREVKQHNNKVCWLLENVKMKGESKQQLDDYLGVTGVLINSALVSFQTRNRYYWSNLEIVQPEDTKTSFQDFKETDTLEAAKYKMKRTLSRERMWANGNGRNSSNSCANVTNSEKVYCLTTKQDRCPNSGLVEFEDFARYLTQKELEQAQTVPVGYTSCLSYNQATKVLGNGWTVKVISHILSGLKKEQCFA